MAKTHRRLLTINVGSSSLKSVLYRLQPGETVEVRAAVERIGAANSSLRIADAQGDELLDRSATLRDHAAALHALFSWLTAQGMVEGLSAIGQRVVHGGNHYSEPTLISGEVLAKLRSLMSLDTEHMPQILDRKSVV